MIHHEEILKDIHDKTRVLHPPTPTVPKPLIAPIYLTTAFNYISEDEAITSHRSLIIKYEREEHPNALVLESVMAALESAEDAVVTNSGMAAVTATLMALLSSGDEVIIPYEAYGAIHRVLDALASKMGIKVRRVWPSTEAIVEAVTKNTKLVFTEVMTNPTLRVIDVGELGKALTGGPALVVDNTFTTPILVRPLVLGATAVVHSLTKYVAGHNDVLGGAVASRSDLIKEVWEWRRLIGAIIQPFDAYLIARGAKTLHVRFAAVSESARAVAEFLAEHPLVDEVHYPGLSTDPYHGIARRLFQRRLYGGVVSFSIRGGAEAAKKFLRNTRLAFPGPSLGGTETLAMLPAESSAKYIPDDMRERLGIRRSLIRLSIGLEDVNDLIEDLDRALKNAHA